MNLVLVDNLVMPESHSFAELDVHPHLGLLALAAVARAAGHTVGIYDPKRKLKSGLLSYDSSLYEHVADELLSSNPDGVGFTTLGCSFIFAVGVAAALKRRQRDLPILLGGPHATMLHEQILVRFPQVDIIVRHEADATLPGVLDRLDTRSFEDVPGVSWRTSSSGTAIRSTSGRPKIDDLDTLPLTSYDDYPIAELGLDLLRIEAGRGCPYNCTFCSTASFFQRSFRLKSSARLVEELDRLHARFGFSDFKLDHDMFTVNRRKVADFCEAVAGRGYRWRASARVDGVDERLLEQMAEAGCVGLYFGIETGSARMQRISQKRLDLGLVHPILDTAARLGIEATASFITGYPEESRDDQDDTLDLLGRCIRRDRIVQLHILTPEPGTPLFEQYGGAVAYDGYGGPYNVDLIGEDDRREIIESPDIFQTYYYYPGAMPRADHIFAVETVALLRRLGPIVAGYLLRAYERRLSLFVAGFRQFTRSASADGRPDALTLEAYLTARFGQTHHLVSLVRFALRAGSARAARAARAADDVRPVDASRFDPRIPYRLGPHAEILDDMHDCGWLIERILELPAEAALLDEARAGERCAYLLIHGEHGTTSYRVDPGAALLVRLFEEPHSWSEIEEFIRESAGIERIDRAFFHRLVSAGVLTPCAMSEPPSPILINAEPVHAQSAATRG